MPETSPTEPARRQPAWPRRRRRIWPWVMVLIVVLLAFLFLHTRGDEKKSAKPANPVIPVTVAEARTGSLDLTLDALGTVTPTYMVTVSSRAGGELTQVLYQEGQEVKKGQLLAIIDPAPYQALVMQVEGQLARDQAALRNAKQDLGRYENAFRQHAIPEQQVATQQAAVDQDEGTIRVDEANLRSAQINLGYTQIHAPIDGRVGLRPVDAGNLISANSGVAIATITQLKPITVIFTLAEDEIAKVAARLEGAKMRVDALDRGQSKVLARGTLITIDNQINPASGTVRARATFTNEHGELFPNQFVNVRLFYDQLRDVTLAPLAAVQRNADRATVYVLDRTTGMVAAKEVKIVATEADQAAITGVEAGAELVTDGFERLQNGSKVTVRGPRSTGAGAAAAE